MINTEDNNMGVSGQGKYCSVRTWQEAPGQLTIMLLIIRAADIRHPPGRGMSHLETRA